jgi:hypothetical protein
VLVTCHGRSSGSRSCSYIWHPDGRPSGSPDWPTAVKIPTGRPSEHTEDGSTAYCFASLVSAKWPSHLVRCSVMLMEIVPATLSADRLSSGDYYGAGWRDASFGGRPRQWRRPLTSGYFIWVEFWRKAACLLTTRVVRSLVLHTCWRASVGKTRFKNLLNRLRFAFKESRNERKRRRCDTQTVWHTGGVTHRRCETQAVWHTGGVTSRRCDSQAVMHGKQLMNFLSLKNTLILASCIYLAQVP